MDETKAEREAEKNNDDRTMDWRGFYGTDAEWKTAVLKALDEGGCRCYDEGKGTQ